MTDPLYLVEDPVIETPIPCVQISTAKLQVEEYKDGDIKYGSTETKINQIQIETEPMEAELYYDILINGYMRDIEKELELIPDDIKAICIAYYYRFLVYNEYCLVNFKKQWNAPKLLIETVIVPQEEGKADKVHLYSGRLVSTIPINQSNSKVKIMIKEIFATDAEFTCTAINDYYASVTDELDLIDGATYTIMETTPSGWWYAVNDDGEDGVSIVSHILSMYFYINITHKRLGAMQLFDYRWIT